MATGQDDEVPTGKEAAIDRIQAMRAQIRPSRSRSSDDPDADPEAAAPSGVDRAEASAPQCPGAPPDDPQAALAQRDATIAALRAEIAMLRREVADIAERITALSARADEACGDD